MSHLGKTLIPSGDTRDLAHGRRVKDGCILDLGDEGTDLDVITPGDESLILRRGAGGGASGGAAEPSPRPM
jgi:hypothetical protein